jgi:exodeoxyribonuclease VII small subunit
MSFENAVRHLQQIVQLLSSGSRSLTESLQLFEKGILLVRAADAELAGIEAKAKDLMTVGVPAEDAAG